MSNIMEDKKSSISNIIDALTKIENNHLNSNRNNAIYSMLKEIGLYTKALYVSIYELVDSSAFELTHQWRLFNNTESPNHDLILPTDWVPCIFNILYQGESIILDDIESIKDSMPTEYNFFGNNNITAVIVFPIIFRKRLMGFVRIDNPNIKDCGDFIDIIPVIGHHMGSIRENNKSEKNKIFRWFSYGVG